MTIWTWQLKTYRSYCGNVTWTSSCDMFHQDSSRSVAKIRQVSFIRS